LKKNITTILLIIFIVFTVSSQNSDDNNKYYKAKTNIENAMPDLAMPDLFFLLKNNNISNSFRDSIKILLVEGYRQKKDFEKGVNMLYEIFPNSINNKYTKARAYNRLAALYDEWYLFGESRFDSTIKYSNKCIQIAKKNNYTKLLASSQNELGYLFCKFNKLEEAEKLLLNAHNIFQKNKLLLYSANVSINLSNLYVKKKDYEKALKIVDESCTKIDLEKNRNMFMRLYLQKASVYEKWGKADSALKYMNKGRIAQKHFFLDKMDKRVYEMSAKYELQQKEHRIEQQRLLNFKKQKENRYLIILITALFIIFIISVIVFYLIRKTLKQKNNLKEIDNQLLNERIAHKNKELSTAIAHSVSYNEVLESVKKALSSKDKEDTIKIINANINTEQNWQRFLLNFNQLYPNFFSNLKMAHPNLTESETKLSALLKMNLKSREIAGVLNIALTSVNKNRQRLRKKLNLQAEMDINLYLSKLQK